MRPTYEFPDFDYDLPTIPGFEDTSWHNDICPSLTRSAGAETLILWCDYADPSLREVEDGKRYTLVQGEYGDPDAQKTLCESDSLADILTAITNALLVGAALRLVQGNTAALGNDVINIPIWSLVTADGCTMFEADNLADIIREISRI